MEQAAGHPTPAFAIFEALPRGNVGNQLRRCGDGEALPQNGPCARPQRGGLEESNTGCKAGAPTGCRWPACFAAVALR